MFLYMFLNFRNVSTTVNMYGVFVWLVQGSYAETYTVQRFSRAGPRGRGREWATLGVHPLSWLLSNNRLEEVCSTLTKGTSSNRLLLSNQDKRSTPSVAHSLPLPLGPALLNLSTIIAAHDCASFSVRCDVNTPSKRMIYRKLFETLKIMSVGQVVLELLIKTCEILFLSREDFLKVLSIKFHFWVLFEIIGKNIFGVWYKFQISNSKTPLNMLV